MLRARDDRTFIAISSGTTAFQEDKDELSDERNA